VVQLLEITFGYLNLNMKKLTISLAFLTLLSLLNTTSIQAQKFYAGVHSSYHFGMGGVMNGYLSATSSSLSATLKDEKVNFGKGIQAGINFGYLLNKNIGIELTFSKALKQNMEMENQIRPSWNGKYSEIIGFNTSSTILSPAIVIKTNYEKLNIYSKLGVMVLKSKQQNTYYENNNTFITDIEYDVEGISGVGFRAALGTSIKINKLIDLQLEINTSNITAKPKREIETKHVENGINLLPTMTVQDKETEFVDEYTITATPAPTNVPNKSLNIYLPYNTLGIQLGLIFKF
jgi:hypothetical protein